MKLFKHSSGAIIAFGFNMQERVQHSYTISWSDVDGKTWVSHAANLAGWQIMASPVDPEFVFEINGDVVAYQPGRCTVMRFMGAPYTWNITTMLPDEARQLRAA